MKKIWIQRFSYFISLIFVSFFCLSITEVKAQPINGWQLDPQQDVKTWRGSWVSTKYFSKNYGVFSSDTAYLWESTAYLWNTMCDYGTCIGTNQTYIVTFNLRTENDFFREDSVIQSYFTNQRNFLAQLQYLNTSGNLVYININNTVSYYMANRVNNNNYSISYTITTPNLPSNANSMEWTRIFIGWTTLTATTDNDYLAYLRTSGKAGITSISIVPATESNLSSHINVYNSYIQNKEIIIGQQKQIEEQEKTNDKLDDFLDSDLSPSDKTLPDDKNFKDYQNAESELTDKMNQADLSNLSIGIDNKSSSWIWTVLTDIIQSHTVVFGMFIAVLSIGVIKLALGR